MPLFGNRKKRRDSESVPNLPKLDLALTFSFFALLVMDVALFSRHEGLPPVLELAGYMAVTAVANVLCKAVSKPFGRAFSTAESLKRPRNLRKFSDQSWQLAIHVVMTIYEVWLLNANGWEWWTDSRTMWDLKQLSGATPCSPEVRRLYLAQLAIWFVTAFSHKYLEAKHNDYFVMYAHHVVTLALLSLSYLNNWQAVGVMTMFIHDSPDIIVDLLKMFNYMGLDSNSGLFLAEIFFAINLVTWMMMRMYYFVTRVIRSTWPLDWFAPGWGDSPQAALLGPGSACRLLLLVLAVMHWYWYYVFLKILVRLIKGSAGHDAGREYEGSSDSEPEDEGAEKKAT